MHQIEGGETQNNFGRNDTLSSCSNIPLKGKSIPSGGKITKIGPKLGRKFTWSEKDKWAIGADQAVPSERPYLNGRLRRVVASPFKKAGGKIKRKNRRIHKDCALKEKVLAEKEPLGKLQYLGGEKDFLEMIISSASLGKFEKRANLAIGCLSETENLGFMRRGEGPVEVNPTDLVESDVAQELGESNDYYFRSSSLFENEQLQQLQLVEVPTMGYCMNSKRERDKNHL